MANSHEELSPVYASVQDTYPKQANARARMDIPPSHNNMLLRSLNGRRQSLIARARDC